MDELEQALSQVRARRQLPAPEARRAIRARAGVSQAQLARAVGVARPTLTYWELGIREPRGDSAIRYMGMAALGRLAAENAAA